MKKIILIMSIFFLSISSIVFAEFEEDVTGTTENRSVYGTVDKETGEATLYDEKGNEHLIDTDTAIDDSIESEDTQEVEKTQDKNYSLDQEVD